MQVKLLIVFEIDARMRWNRPDIQPSLEAREESVERHLHVN